MVKDLIIEMVMNAEGVYETIGNVQRAVQVLKTSIATRSNLPDLYRPFKQAIPLIEGYGNTASSAFNKAGESAKRANKRFRKVRRGFDMAALGIMFFGMAIMRATSSIWKSSTKLFQEIMHSTEGTVTGFDMLNDSLAYLGFTAGQALEPLAAELMPIVDTITQWIGDNKELFRGLVKWAAIFGTILFVVGTLKLGFGALFKYLIPAIVSVWKFSKHLQGAWIAIKAVGLSKYMGLFFPKIVKLWAALKGAAAWAWANVVPWLAWVALIAVVIALIASIMVIWDKLVVAFKIRIKQLVSWWEGFVDTMKSGAKVLGIFVKLAWLGIREAFSAMIVWIADKWEGFVNGFINAYNWVAKKLKKTEIEPFVLDFEKADFSEEIKTLEAEAATIGLEWAAREAERETLEQGLLDQLAYNFEKTEEELGDFWSKENLKELIGNPGALPDELVDEPVEPIEVTTDNSTTVYNITLEPQRENESMEEYTSRLLAIMNEES